MADAVYHPPTDSPPGSSEPSAVAKTLGVLSIIFGGLNAASNLLGLLMQGVATRLQQMQPAAQPEVIAMRHATEQVAPYNQAIAAMMLVMSIALLFIGIGLRKHSAAARQAAVAWSVLAFVVLGVRAWIFERKVWPVLEVAMRPLMEKVGEQAHGNLPFNPATFTNTVAHASNYASLGFLAIYPALMLILLNLPSVRERFRGA
jgi:hypothetical protein